MYLHQESGFRVQNSLAACRWFVSATPVAVTHNWATFNKVQPPEIPWNLNFCRHKHKQEGHRPKRAKSYASSGNKNPKNSPERYFGHFRKFWKFGWVEPAHVLKGGGGGGGGGV